MGTAETILVIGLVAAAGFALWYFSGSFPGPANSTLQWRVNPVTGGLANFLSGRGPMGPSTGFPGTISRTQTSDPRGSGGGVGGSGRGVVPGSPPPGVIFEAGKNPGEWKKHSAKYIAYY